tara:strand:- start:485 stop:736 length:252 start_codon:yes stop_codon:yes gene_type:complete
MQMGSKNDSWDVNRLAKLLATFKGRDQIERFIQYTCRAVRQLLSQLHDAQGKVFIRSQSSYKDMDIYNDRRPSRYFFLTMNSM